MKYLKKSIYICVLAILMAIPVCASIASAQQDLDPLFIMNAGGGAKQDNFYVNDLFNTKELAPIALTTLIALPAGTQNPDTFTITITPGDKSKSFTYKDSYMLIGFSYALSGTPAPIIASNTYPLPIVAKVPIKSNFGFATIGLIVTSAVNLDPADVIPPFSFTIKVELSAAAAPAAEE
ncbi:MAG: hypothetical protein NTV89_12595 [Proteobacteria bacterium]|nr:hypothetical protein [Pseudomonadota bacterium]